MAKAKTKKTTKKQPALATLKKKLDAVFSVFIRRRDKGVCFTCGNKKPWKYQQNGHYVTRGCMQLRWDERNCNCQCAGCNIFKNGNYTEYAVRLVRKYGPTILEELDKEKWKIRKMTRANYEDLIAHYTKLNGLTKG